MKFEVAYKTFIEKQLKGKKGERLKRIIAGQSITLKWFLEHVWWPCVGNFDNLHPEYEINDFKDGLRFIDFAFFIFTFRIAIEIDDYGTHIQKVTRWQHSDHCLRQNHLSIDGWKIIRFTLDDIKERPRMCIQIIQQMIGKLSGIQFAPLTQVTIEEKEILKLCFRLNRNLTPNDVCLLLDVKKQKSRKLLQGLKTKELLVSAGYGEKRINCYRPHPNLTSESFIH